MIAGRTWRVAVTREAGKNGELARLLHEAGAEVVEAPLIRFTELPPTADLLDALRDFRGWLLLTSPQGARSFLSLEIPLPHARFAAVGEATAQVLLEAGCHLHFIPSRADARTLGAELPAQPGEMALQLTSQQSAETLREMLEVRGISYQRFAIYRTEAAPLSAGQIAQLRGADVITLTSGSAAQALAQAAGTDFTVAVMGQQTAQVAQSLGFKQVWLARGPSLAALAEAACPTKLVHGFRLKTHR